jgi:hypothetical protein
MIVVFIKKGDVRGIETLHRSHTQHGNQEQEPSQSALQDETKLHCAKAQRPASLARFCLCGEPTHRSDEDHAKTKFLHHDPIREPQGRKPAIWIQEHANTRSNAQKAQNKPNPPVN